MSRDDKIAMLDVMLQKIATDGPVRASEKLHDVRDRIVKYHQKHYSEEIFRVGDLYAMFCFDIGMLTGIISYYHKNDTLRKTDMVELNTIYKKYK